MPLDSPFELPLGQNQSWLIVVSANFFSLVIFLLHIKLLGEELSHLFSYFYWLSSQVPLQLGVKLLRVVVHNGCFSGFFFKSVSLLLEGHSVSAAFNGGDKHSSEVDDKHDAYNGHVNVPEVELHVKLHCKVAEHEQMVAAQQDHGFVKNLKSSSRRAIMGSIGGVPNHIEETQENKQLYLITTLAVEKGRNHHEEGSSQDAQRNVKNSASIPGGMNVFEKVKVHISNFDICAQTMAVLPQEYK